MGYSHHFYFEENREPGTFDEKVVNDCKAIIAEYDKRHPSAPLDETYITDSSIWINSSKAMIPEFFAIYAMGSKTASSKGMSWCKTERYPYDWAICAILIYLKWRYKDALFLASDGGTYSGAQNAKECHDWDENWKDAYEWLLESGLIDDGK